MQKSDVSDYFRGMLYEPILRAALLKVTKAFASSKQMGITTVARRYLGDSKLFDRIEGGGTFSVRFYDRAISRFSDEWPVNVPWPEGVPRPSKKQVETARKLSLKSTSTAWN